jgi:hypothetical protein
LREDERPPEVHPEDLVELLERIVEDGMAGDDASVAAHRRRLASVTGLHLVEDSLNLLNDRDVSLQLGRLGRGGLRNLGRYRQVN